MRGTVVAFDSARGVGEIAGPDGARYPFHATVVADGTRNVDVGAVVEFDVVPGHLGRWEASAIVKC